MPTPATYAPERLRPAPDTGVWDLPHLDWRRPDGGVTRVRFGLHALDPAAWLLRDLLAGADPVRVGAVVAAPVAAAWPEARAAVAAYCAAHRDALDLVAPPAPAERCAPVVEQAIAAGGPARLLVLGDEEACAAAARATSDRRRVTLVHVPTTLRAQADAGAAGARQRLRADAVLCDFALLRLGDPAGWREGLCLAVEAATLRDEAFLSWIEHQVEDIRAGSLPVLAWIVHRTAQLRVEAAASGALATWPSNALRAAGAPEARSERVAAALVRAAEARGGAVGKLDPRRVARLLEALDLAPSRARAAGAAQARPIPGASPAATSR